MDRTEGCMVDRINGAYLLRQRMFVLLLLLFFFFFFRSLSRKFSGPVQWPFQGKLSDANGRRASFGGFFCAFPQMRHNFLCMNCAGRPHQQRHAKVGDSIILFLGQEGCPTEMERSGHHSSNNKRYNTAGSASQPGRGSGPAWLV
ncbi:uncharacterized protein BO87DRAFT_40686 [Aspergillus neoniger CBS 115656]|uniref:Uncharacterized protein n=1 Tax=Aspergillus neoniger (strain CBS 115656) TaxID=1448310 RepID=A0A318YK56_ASPNB|nr:hypothetical protein BO87DRAFT_40686 [Aspergillus neoniger CBS 115656]PYH34709.1 hypothetical protein BO87DRAFT_40686 [Aspergillus neoniger CBS 115656]